MTVPTCYVETSCWGSLPRGQPRDRRQVVRRLLELLDGTRGICVISGVVLGEIALASPEEAEMMRRQVDAMPGLLIRPMTAAVEELARAYVEAGILPERRSADAAHIALATCYGCDYLVSWNHRHMTRPKKKLQYEAVNRPNGYLKTPLICNPWEACDELRSR